MTRGPKRRWTDEQLVIAVKSGCSIRGVLRQLSLDGAGTNYRTIKRHIHRLGLDISQWMGQGHLKGKSATWSIKPLDSILVEHSGYAGGTSSLKKRIIRKGLLKNECVLCGQLPEWKGKPLVMVLDHINGVNDDNRIDNFRLLCPNCNSQSDTFCRGAKGLIRKEKKICSSCGKESGRCAKNRLCARCRGIKKSFPQRMCSVCGKPVSSRSVSGRCKKCVGVGRGRKVNRPSYEELKQMVATMSMCAIGRKYGVSDNAVRKWIKVYDKDCSIWRDGEVGKHAGLKHLCLRA